MVQGSAILGSQVATARREARPVAFGLILNEIRL